MDEIRWRRVVGELRRIDARKDEILPPSLEPSVASVTMLTRADLDELDELDAQEVELHKELRALLAGR
jgi:hypothetical protein